MLSPCHLDFFFVVYENKSFRLKCIFLRPFWILIYIYIRYFITCTGNNFPIMQYCQEKSTIASSGNIIAKKDKNPQDRISIYVYRDIWFKF